jgi:YgiT-type zinc finger domain-containing protein
MVPEQLTPPPTPCPRCDGTAASTMVRTAIWRGDAAAIVEDIPALVCSSCMEQFYDEDVSDALRQLIERGFPESEATRHIQVPVFSLQGMVRPRMALPDDTHLD